MNDVLTQLIAILEELASTLRKYGEQHWSRWLYDDTSTLRKGDRRGIDHFLSAFGGMGSLNDVFLCPENGNVMDDKDVAEVNEQLRNLISRAYNLARDIQRTI